MLTKPPIQQLHSLRLNGMAAALDGVPDHLRRSFEDRLALMPVVPIRGNQGSGAASRRTIQIDPIRHAASIAAHAIGETRAAGAVSTPNAK